MKLLSNEIYNRVETLLREYYNNDNTIIEYTESMREIKQFFNASPYKEFLQIFYFDRYKYKYRYPSNRMLFAYLCGILHVEEPTLYNIRREIIYKSAMIFYKNNIMEENKYVE